MNIGDRVKLISDYKLNDIEIKSGTVCTVVSIISDTAIIRYDCEKDRNIIAGVSINSLYPITNIDELKDLDSKNLVHYKYQIGKKFILEMPLYDYKIGHVFTINDIDLFPNEKDDIFYMQSAENENIIPLKRYNIDSVMIPYVPEFEESLNNEVDLQTTKNYHLPGARMKTKDDKIVFVIKPEDDKFVVEDSFGVTYKLDKEELIPFEKSEELYNYDKEQVIHQKFRTGKKYVAAENIVKHPLLKINHTPGDIVTIKYDNTIHINSMDDTYAVDKKGIEFILSAYELENFFEPYQGMIKHIVGKIQGTSSDLEEEQSNVKEVKSSVDIVTYMNEEYERLVAEAQLADEPKILIRAVTVDNYDFTIVYHEGNPSFLCNSQVQFAELDRFERCIRELKKLIEKGN